MLPGYVALAFDVTSKVVWNDCSVTFSTRNLLPDSGRPVNDGNGTYIVKAYPARHVAERTSARWQNIRNSFGNAPHPAR